MDLNQPSSHPGSPQSSDTGADLAADVIREKLNNLYQKEPDAVEEKKEVTHLTHRSKHQKFMYELTQSGMSLADIQTAWHNYYVALPDSEKHEVWQEFYDAHSRAKQSVQHQPVHHTEQPPHVPPAAHHAHPAAHHRRLNHRKKEDPRTVGAIKEQLIGTVNSRGKLKAKHHLQSIAFGLGVGGLVVLILLFSFFNERIIAPFITPSRTVSNTPIIADGNTTTNDPTPKIIIPKINLEVPVVYDQASIDEHAIQGSLEQGVVHYATTPAPGEKGNAVIFGHSSNNILNKGKYKFAFVLLNRLETGDTFFLTKDGKRYVYKVYDRKIVKPTDVQVLGSTEKIATATLITCDPPGTSLNRLVVFGEQITPDPNANAASTAIKTNTAPSVVPSDAPSLWRRITSWFNS